MRDTHLLKPSSLCNLKPGLHTLHSLEDRGSKQFYKVIFLHTFFSNIYPVLHLIHYNEKSYSEQLSIYSEAATSIHLSPYKYVELEH